MATVSVSLVPAEDYETLATMLAAYYQRLNDYLGFPYYNADKNKHLEALPKAVRSGVEYYFISWEGRYVGVLALQTHRQKGDLVGDILLLFVEDSTPQRVQALEAALKEAEKLLLEKGVDFIELAITPTVEEELRKMGVGLGYKPLQEVLVKAGKNDASSTPFV